MNLYYALTNYHLLCCILHALKYHTGENNVLYLSRWHPDCIEMIDNLKKSNIFSRVELFDEVDSPSGNKKIDSKQINCDINEIVSKIPINFISDVNLSKEVNIAGDHYCCSIYLVNKKINYNYFEDACGILSDENRLLRYLKNSDYSRYQIIKKLKLPGNHSYILKRFGNLKQQQVGYFNKKDIDFSIPEILKEISDDDISRIINIFSKEKIKVPDNAVLFLTFHYVTMQLLNLEEQKLLYLLLVDYFCNDKNLIIKPHPSDIQPNYSEWFPDSIVLPRKMPSELLPILNSKKFLRALTAYSTSITLLKDYCGDVISFSSNIEKNFYSINKYYFVLQLLNNYLTSDYEIFALGVDDSIINNLMYEYNISNFKINFVSNIDVFKKNQKKIILIDKFESSNLESLFEEKLNKNDIIFFLDLKKLTNLSNKNLMCMNNLFSVFLSKTLKDDNKSCEKFLLNDEIIEIYCYDKNFIDYVSSQTILKELKYSNIIISMKTNIVSELNKLYDKINLLENKNIELHKNIDELNVDKQKLQYDLEASKIKCLEYIKDIDEGRKEVDKYKSLYDNILLSSSWKLTKGYRKIGGFIKKILRKG